MLQGDLCSLNSKSTLADSKLSFLVSAQTNCSRKIYGAVNLC